MQELGDIYDFVAGGDERQAGDVSEVHLGQANRPHQSVADAFASVRFFDGAAFADVILHRFGGAAVADGAVGLAVGAAAWICCLTRCRAVARP